MDFLRSYGFFTLAALLLVASFTLTTGSNAAYALIPQLAAILAACAGLVARDTLTGTLATALACFGFNTYLFMQKIDSASGRSLCNIDQVFNCDKVNGSPWSMAGDIPITLIGMAFYAGLIGAGLLAPQGVRRSPIFDRITAIFAVLSCAYSAFLFVISQQLGAWCVVCISIYIGNIILLWAGWKGLREASAGWLSDLPSTMMSREAMALVATFVVGIIWGRSWFEQQIRLPEIPPGKTGSTTSATPPSSPSALSSLYVLPGGPLTIDGQEPLLGRPDAKYTIVEFADFGCPHCAEAEKQLKDLVAANDDVAVRFKYFPLSGACNPMLADPSNPNDDASRCHAAYAAECANQQQRFWELIHLLFTNQGLFERDQLEIMAKDSGVNLAKWNACMDDPATAATVEKRAREGEAAGVRGTPALYLQGIFPDQIIQIQRGPIGALTLIEAHRDGAAMPPPTPSNGG